MCDVCDNKSPGSQNVGVTSLSTGAMSIMFCQNCLNEGAEPLWAFQYLYDFVATNYDIETLREDIQELKAWKDGRYITLKEWWQTAKPGEYPDLCPVSDGEDILPTVDERTNPDFRETL